MTTFLFKAAVMIGVVQSGLVADAIPRPRNELERLVLTGASWERIAQRLEALGDQKRQDRELIAAGFKDGGAQGGCHWYHYGRTIGSNGLVKFGSVCLSSDKPVVMLGQGFPGRAVAPSSGSSSPSVPVPPQVRP